MCFDLMKNIFLKKQHGNEKNNENNPCRCIYNNSRIWCLYKQKSESMSDLALSNVEALAKPEIWIAFCIDAPYVCNGQGIEDIDGIRQY